MESSKFDAIHAAGVGCVLTLIIIGITVFNLSSQQLIKYLTLLGGLVGQGTTIGILMVAALPLIVGVIFYYFWLWVLK